MGNCKTCETLAEDQEQYQDWLSLTLFLQLRNTTQGHEKQTFEYQEGSSSAYPRILRYRTPRLQIEWSKPHFFIISSSI